MLITSGRHVDEHHPHGVALLVVLGRGEGQHQADRGQHRGDHAEHRRGPGKRP
jgi:hypothetical protein